METAFSHVKDGSRAWPFGLGSLTSSNGRLSSWLTKISRAWLFLDASLFLGSTFFLATQVIVSVATLELGYQEVLGRRFFFAAFFLAIEWLLASSTP